MDFQKIFQNFDELFFRSTKFIFRALPKHCFAPILAKFSTPQANFDKKIAFFLARAPSES